MKVTPAQITCPRNFGLTTSPTAKFDALEGRFAKLMSDPASDLPELKLGQLCHQASQTYQSRMAELASHPGRMLDPVTTMKTVQNWVLSNSEVEVAAKVLGSVGQSINRLVSIQ